MWVSFRGHASVTVLADTVFGPVSKTTYILKSDYSHCTAHFQPMSFGFTFEQVTERLFPQPVTTSYN